MLQVWRPESKRAFTASESERAFFVQIFPSCIELERRLDVVHVAGGCIADADGRNKHPVADEDGLLESWQENQ